MWNRRSWDIRLFVITSAMILVSVIVSPLLLAIVAAAYDPAPLEWIDLANIGQAYSGAAALISTLALVAIAGSLLLQWRQTRLAQIIAIRERHFELAKLGIERPELIPATGGRSDPAEAVVVSYSNLWIAHWAIQWDLEIMSEAHLRHLARNLFRNAIVRRWWSEQGDDWSTANGSRRRRFIAILTQECTSAVSSAQLDESCTSNSPSLTP